MRTDRREVVPVTNLQVVSQRVTKVTDASGDVAACNVGPRSGYGRLYALGFDSEDDASTNYTLVDADGRTIYSLATVDASTPIYRKLVHDAVEGSDGAAAVNQGVGIFRFPWTFDIADGGDSKTHITDFVYETGWKFASQPFTTSAGGAATCVIPLPGAKIAVVAQLFLQNGAADASTDYSIVDGDGRTVYVKSGLDADAPSLYLPLTYDAVEGSDGAGIADVGGPMPFKSPLVCTVANGGNALTGRVGAFYR